MNGTRRLMNGESSPLTGTRRSPHRVTSLRWGIAMLMAGVFLLGSCTNGSANEPSTPESTSGGQGAEEITGEIIVFAAASLKESFEQIAAKLQAANPELSITFQYGASGQLQAQIEQGAPADVYASADEVSMEAVVDGGLVTDPIIVASNQPQIVAPAGNPGNIADLEDLTNEDLTIVTCAEAAACGKIQAQIEEKVGFEIASDSEEPDVKSVLQKVSLGEADAGLVYVTDVQSAGETVIGIDITQAAEFANKYPIGVVTGSANEPAATAFVEYVSGPDGQQILQSNGFGPV